MTWELGGWAVIILSAILMVVLTIVFNHHKGYQARRLPAVDALMASRVAAIEKGLPRQVVVGQQLWSQAYPGVGLHTSTVLPAFLDPETGVDGGLTVSGGEGSMVVLARQIIKMHYKEGFSTSLHDQCVRVSQPGLTPFSFTAGLLTTSNADAIGSLSLFGNYGPEAALWTALAASKGGYIFASAGSLASQAVLFPSVRDLLIGEEMFLMPGLCAPTANHRAAWLTEDILRIALMGFLLTAVVLKMVGVL